MESTNKEIAARSRAILRDKWGVAMGGTVLLYAVMIGVGVIPLVGTILSLVMSGPFITGLYGFYLKIARGQRPPVLEIFSGFSNFLNAMATYLLYLLLVFLWTLLLIVPGIIMLFAYSQAFYLIADDPTLTASRALRESRAMMRGRKWKYFRLNCRYIGWILLGIVTLGIAFLWVLPMLGSALALFHDDLKNARAGATGSGDENNGATPAA
jgi:uncharacterized membrane protein